MCVLLNGKWTMEYCSQMQLQSILALWELCVIIVMCMTVWRYENLFLCFPNRAQFSEPGLQHWRGSLAHLSLPQVRPLPLAAVCT